MVLKNYNGVVKMKDNLSLSDLPIEIFREILLFLGEAKDINNVIPTAKVFNTRINSIIKSHYDELMDPNNNSISAPSMFMKVAFNKIRYNKDHIQV